MGVRIDIFAIDESRFETFIERPVGAALFDYFQHGTDSSTRLYFWDVPRGLEFASSPSTGFSIRQLSEPFDKRVVAWDQLKGDPFLANRLRDYLNADSSVGLSTFLSRFSRCSSVDFIREITSGYRRWWIGSLLDYAETAVDVNSKEYSEVSDLFQRMLRGYECGKPLKPIEWKLARGIFPVLPADDLEMGVWTNEETLRVLRFIRALLNKAKPNFRRPPGEIGIAVETDAEWNEWVYLMLRQLLSIIELPFERLKIVSFIG